MKHCMRKNNLKPTWELKHARRDGNRWARLFLAGVCATAPLNSGATPPSPFVAIQVEQNGPEHFIYESSDGAQIVISEVRIERDAHANVIHASITGSTSEAGVTHQLPPGFDIGLELRCGDQVEHLWVDGQAVWSEGQPARPPELCAGPALEPELAVIAAVLDTDHRASVRVIADHIHQRLGW